MNENSSENINELIKELVITRINAQMTPNMKLSIGGFGSMTKEDMINHINQDDEIGKMIIDVHLNFLQAQSSGELTSALVSV